MIVLCGSVIEKIKTFFSRPFFSNPITLFWLWIGLGVISALTKFNKCNNFLVLSMSFGIHGMKHLYIKNILLNILMLIIMDRYSVLL